jgi:hypothetical protein
MVGVIFKDVDMKNAMSDEIELADGAARALGCGAVIILQTDEYGVGQSVVLSGDDLARLQALAA